MPFQFENKLIICGPLPATKYSISDTRDTISDKEH